MPSADDPIRDAHAAIQQAIVDLKAIGVPVPMALYLAAHALAYARAERPGGTSSGLPDDEPQR
jgi:hypothetical protein